MKKRSRTLHAKKSTLSSDKDYSRIIRNESSMTKCKNKLNQKRSNSKRSKRDFQHENNGESCEKNEFKLSQKD